MSRMTDERLAEFANAWANFRLTQTESELFEAMKAERERVRQLEAFIGTDISAADRIAELERSREQLDCRYAGSHWESSGSHCPADKPCMRCATQARLDAVEAFCERAVNAYPDLRDEYEALEQKDVTNDR